MGTAKGRAASQGIFRLSVAHFLIALVLLLVAVPLADEFHGGDLVESILITVALLSAVVAVGGRRRTFAIAILLVVPAVVGKWATHFWPHHLRMEFTQATAIVFLAFVVFRLLRFILTAPRVDSEVLCAAVAVYLILALGWAFAFSLVASLDPKAFAFTVPADPHREMVRFQALYFSFITLTTVGYGDIVPLSKIARLLAMAESTSGVFFATILIARLVSLYSTAEPGRGGTGSNG